MSTVLDLNMVRVGSGSERLTEIASQYNNDVRLIYNQLVQVWFAVFGGQKCHPRAYY